MNNPAAKRMKTIYKLYGRRPLSVKTVYIKIHKAAQTQTGLSVVRLGDVMAKLLTRSGVRSLNRVANFLGMPFPPPDRLLKELRWAVINADIVGVSHFPTSSLRLIKYMAISKWHPRLITDAFINDQLFYSGYLHKLLSNHRCVLIGRSATAAANSLQEQGIRAKPYMLDNYDQMRGVYRKLAKSKKEWDLAIVGASVPGRILCTKIARRLNKPAVEVGHMLDALAYPNEWRIPGNRLRFKRRWIQGVGLS